MTSRGPSAGPRYRATRGRRRVVAAALVLGALLLPPLVGLAGASAGPDPVPARSAGSPLSPAPVVAASDWPTFHGSENRSGFTPFLGPGTPDERWASSLSSVSLRSGPVVAGPEFFVADALGTVYAVNRSTGTPLWNASVSGPPSQLDVADGALVVGTGSGGLFAFDPATGRPLWSVPLSAGLIQGPTVGNGSVYVGTTGGEVAAFALATGVSEWRALFPSAIGGALALENGVLYGATANGTVFALAAASGRALWSTSVPSGVATAPAVFGSTVVVGDLGGNVSAFATATGALLWRWPGASPSRPDSIHATPTIGLGRVYVQRDSGTIVALDLSNGSFLWATPSSFSPYPYVSSPALAPNGLYTVNEGIQSLVDVDPATGATLWTLQEPDQVALFSSPAIADGVLYFGADDGAAYAFGAPATVDYPVSGLVTDTHGDPLAGVAVGVPNVASALTNASGGFSLSLPNGTYALEALLPYYNVVTLPLAVTGPVGGLRFVLGPLTVYAVTGVLANQYSGEGVAGALLTFQGPNGFNRSVETGASGGFAVSAPNGTLLVLVSPPAGYQATTTVLRIAGAGVSGFDLTVAPTGASVSALDPDLLVIALPFLGTVAAVATARLRQASRARVSRGLPPQVLSPFGRFVLMRLLLIPAQLALLFAVLYVFLDAVPSAVAGARTTALGFFEGYASFFGPVVTGHWGIITIGKIRAPVTAFLGAYLPPSIELAAFALGISLAIAYPLGLLAGWRSGGALDPAARTGSLLGLLVPTFVVGFVVLFFAYASFFHAVGDIPLGTLPTDAWLLQHGGLPSWITILGTTQPTGFPLLDGALHGAWPFERVVLLKTLLQAAIIALVYVTIFLRYARSLVAEASQEAHVTAARARGVPDRTILWRHTARRVWPVYALVFGLTIPVYIGTQAVVEVLFLDTGVGTVLLYGAANLAVDDLLTRVLLLLLAALILLLTLSADVFARYLDPRSRSEEA